MRVYAHIFEAVMSFNRYSADMKTHNELRQLRKRVEDFESGEIYQKFIIEYEKKLASKDREIIHINAQYDRLNERNRLLLSENELLKGKLEQRDCDVERLNRWIEERDEEINELRKKYNDRGFQIERLKALLNTDSTNSGISTAKTPLNKDKIRPNSRKNTGNPRGGVKGHKKAHLKSFSDDEINEFPFHPYEDNCPLCDCELEYTGNDITKDETDIEVKTVKRRHRFGIYRCRCCGKEIHIPIPNNLKEENQYGPMVQATALSLMNSCNTAMNKAGDFLAGITDGNVNPCDGYMAKLQKRAASLLAKFREDLRNLLIERPVVYWDDTVIMIDKKRGCLRFYGDERIAWYAAHAQKDLDGILEDQILQYLNEMTTVMHDHNTVNYNKAFIFRNIECNVHLIRDLQKVFQILNHSWANDMCEHISKTIHERKELIAQGKDCFNNQKISEFNSRIDSLLTEGRKQNHADRSSYYGNEEFTLLNRIEKFRENYFLWVKDFTMPTTDSLSERALRGVKSKMKISGQFHTVQTADYYAIIKSYVETCHRNGINEFDALQRLASGKPYTVQEIFQLNLC